MIGIAIFEENIQAAAKMKGYINRFFENLRIDFYISIFTIGEEKLPIKIRTNGYDVIFLAVSSENETGISLAQQIRLYSKDSMLVLVSDSTKYAIEGYKLEVFRYILKSRNSFESDLEECMGAVLDKRQIDLKYIEFNFLEGKKIIPVNNVMYIESNQHKVVFYIWENGIKKYTKYGGLNKVTEELCTYGFIRIHKSFSVNMFHIVELCRYRVSLRMGVKLSVPKNRYREIKEAYMDYKNETGCY